MAESRETDLVLAPNEFIFIQDLNTGFIKPVVGPTKKTLDSTEQPVIYQNSRFLRCAPKEGIQVFPVADERSYLVLENPAKEREHPVKGQDNPMPVLMTGQKKNIPGPTTFALWPGQVATVIQGHQLRSNQYLRCVVHNAKEAIENWDKAVIDSTNTVERGSDRTPGVSETAVSAAAERKKLVTGQILIIEGKKISYFIPPTGINVIPVGGTYVREAVTLERLEYCILLDESGKKRYVKGPDVVFPLPTETFIEKDNERKFRALELNENMGIYVKVIADYEDHKTGEELFITGKEQKIYYPQAEHAIIKYDDQAVHYAVAIPKGEGRYVLDKNTGEIPTVVGPKMFLPDPRKNVIVLRALTDREVSLWFPGNTVALAHNRTLQKSVTGGTEKFARMMPTASADNAYSSALGELMCDDLSRHTSYTPPRTITIDSKYEGAVVINIWPGYAVQVVSKSGDREVIIGPKCVVLGYDQTLEVMELSTGKPKTDHNLFKTVYLRVKNNRVSDVVEADTKDMVHIMARVDYRVNFEGDPKQWFSVENYVKFLTQNLRSIIRNEVQKYGVEEISQKITNVIRDVILGVSLKEKDKEKERQGRLFPENGMRVYDVEVLSLSIGDEQIRDQLIHAQHETVENALEVAAKKQELENTKAIETCEQEILKLTNLTQVEKQKIVEEELKQKFVQEELKGKINQLVLDFRMKDFAVTADNQKTLSDIQTEAFERRFKALTPDLIAALEASGNVDLAKTFAEHIPQAGGGVGLVLGHTLIQNLMGMVRGTAMEKALQSLTSDRQENK